MAAKTLEELRASFAKPTESENTSGVNWKAFFKFYKMDFDEQTTFRFLPDLDEDNPRGFLYENKTHSLVVNGNKRTVACLEMYGEDCPICAKSREIYNQAREAKDSGNEAEEKRLKAIGSKYYRKLDYIGQGFPVKVPFQDDYTSDNPVRPISISKKIYEIIQKSIMNGDVESLPYDVTEGYDFRFSKTKQGEYADYSTSRFAPRATEANEDNLAKAIMWKLEDLRQPKISFDELEAMLRADMTGAAYNSGKQTAAPASAAPVVNDPVVQQAVATSSVQAEVKEETTTTASPARGQAFLDQIRNRIAAQQSTQE